MMKPPYCICFIFILSLEINVVSAGDAKESSDAKARTTEFENDNSGPGEYRFKFHTTNDIEREESGRLEDDGSYVVEGFYSFVADDGKRYFVTYVADKTGYHPTVIFPADLPTMQMPGIPQSGVSSHVVATLLG